MFTDWYYQVPLKPETKSEVSHPPTSQIPGLSDLAEPPSDLMAGSQKNWIRDTDSDYVKLSKQGGQPGKDHIWAYRDGMNMSKISNWIV